MQEEMLEARVQGQVKIDGKYTSSGSGRGHGPLGPVNISHKKDGH